MKFKYVTVLPTFTTTPSENSNKSWNLEWKVE